MQIHKLVIKKLYGYIDKEIDFNDDINILVGINGSGKTSVLNIINWLLQPSFPNLCVTEYEQIDLYFTFKNEEYKLTSKQDKVEVTLDLENQTTQKKFNRIQATFTVHPSEITKNQSRKESAKHTYAGLGPDQEEIESWNFIFKKVPSPVIIGLDRNIYAEEGDDYRILNERKTNFPNEPSIGKTPLDKVIELARRSYGIYRLG